MDTFSKLGPSVTNKYVTALKKLSACQAAMDNRLHEMLKNATDETLP